MTLTDNDKEEVVSLFSEMKEFVKKIEKIILS